MDFNGDQANLEVRLRHLQATYVRLLDEDRLEEVPDLFTPEASYRVITYENKKADFPIAIIDAANRDMLIDRIAALRHANVYEPQRYRHILSFLTIDNMDGTTAKCTTSFLVIRTMIDGTQELFVSGVYEDVIDLSGSDVLFKEKTVVLDGDKIDTLIAIPI